MKLKEYLIKEECGQREFARLIGIAHQTIGNIIKGKRPNKKNAMLIEKFTRGKVIASDLLSQEKWKNVNKFK